MDRSEITQDLLRSLLTYDPETGDLFWRERPIEIFNSHGAGLSWNKRYANTVALSFVTRRGYKHGTIFGKSFLAHRVCYALHHGLWPENHIDHINGIKTDNRISNLRDVDHVENQKNKPMQSNNKSGHTGVFWCTRDRKWQASIHAKGRLKYLGQFSQISDAVAARDVAKSKFGYTERHGKKGPRHD